MPPPNLTDATAIEITSLPYEVTTDPEHNNNELWYKYVATDGDVPIIGAHVYGLGGVYKPQVAVSEGPLGSYVDHPDGSGFYATQKSIIVPVDSAQTYFFRISGGSGSSYSSGQTFTLNIYNAPSETVRAGEAFLIPDDSDGFPAVFVDKSTGEILRYADTGFPASERSDSLPSGHVLTEDGPFGSDLKLYDGQLNLVTTLSGLASSTLQIRTNGTDLFYTSNGATLRAIDDAGSTQNTWTLAATPVSMAPAKDDGIVYYASSGTGAAVRRFDLVGNTALSNLAAGVASYFIGEDMLTLDDGSILVHYFKTAGGVDHFIRRYDEAGSITQTYAFGTSAINRMSRGTADDHIYVWQQSGGQGTFKKMLVSDGTFPESWSQYDTVTGVSSEPATATPTNSFGHSFSCPVVPFYGSLGASPVLDDSDPCCIDVSSLIREVLGCSTGPNGGAGSSGPMQPPEPGTWTNTLNATDGSGGGANIAWYRPDPGIAESWN